MARVGGTWQPLIPRSLGGANGRGWPVLPCILRETTRQGDSGRVAEEPVNPGSRSTLKEGQMDCTGVCRYHPCPDCEPKEHRGSRIPPHLPTVDPLLADAAFKEFAPSEETIKEKEGG